MSAVIRVKRLLDADPVDTIVLNYKKRKIDDSSNEEAAERQPTVLKLAGTLNSQEEDIFKHIKRSTKVDVEENFKRHPINITDKLRQEIQEKSKNNRFKVISCYRSDEINEDEIDKADDCAKCGSITVVDVEIDNEKQTKENEERSSSDPQYVYDLYYTNSDDFGEIDLNELVSVYPLSEELIFGSARDNGCIESTSDSEDSNAENYWRNDYPDESDMESITEEDMLEAVSKLDINGENELSSDDGEEGFVYSVDSEAAGFEEDVDPTDVRRYGEMYARFKARTNSVVTTPLDNNLYYGDIDEEEYYY